MRDQVDLRKQKNHIPSNAPTVGYFPPCRRMHKTSYPPFSHIPKHMNQHE